MHKSKCDPQHPRTEITLSDIGEALRQMREGRNLSQAQLRIRTQLRVSRNTILRVEKGYASTVSTLMLLAEGMKASLADIIQRAEKIHAQRIGQSQ